MTEAEPRGAFADRTSCLIERGRACVAGFERLGLSFSADITRQMVNALECGAPGSLYDHWIAEQEARLRSKLPASERLAASATSEVFCARQDAWENPATFPDALAGRA